MDRGYEFDYVVPIEQMKNFIKNCIKSTGCNDRECDSVVDMLIDADIRGHYSHGVNRLHIYIRDLQTNTCKIDGKPFIVKTKGSTALIDGDNALGSIVGEFSMNLAIQLAKEHGIGWVTTRNSNHFGTAGRYCQMASDQGLIGMAFTNTSPCLFPTRSAEKALGSNPISFYAPGNNGDKFALDMATSTVAYGKVEMAQVKGKQVPTGWGADVNGWESTNPEVILNGGGLLPLGGTENTGGYKGTGLCQMVEILCGIMAGSSFGKNVREWQGVATKADLGQCFIVVDPECFAFGFNERLQQFINETRDLKPVDGSTPVRIPGDLSKNHIERSIKDGLLYHKSVVQKLELLAKELKISMFEYHPYDKS